MSNTEEKKKLRKEYGKHGDGSTQKMFSFRLDKVVESWLNSKPNKGRYLNELIRSDMKRAWLGDDEHTEELDSIEQHMQ